MINFVIPDFWDKFNLNKALIALMKSHREMFLDDMRISAVYGTFHLSTWDGGRLYSRYIQASYEDMQIVKDFFEENEIPLRFTFTSTAIDESMLADTFCNLALEMFDGGKHEIVVNSPLLEKYISETYPRYGMISSVTKRLANIKDAIHELENPRYKYVCLDYDLNNRFDLYEKIPPELFPKIELLVSETCMPGCKNRKSHYAKISKASRDYGNDLAFLDCPVRGRNMLDQINCGYRSQVSPKAIIETYAPMGFQHFKLAGRSFSDEFQIEMYKQYLVKSEYQNQFVAQMSALLDEYSQGGRS